MRVLLYVMGAILCVALLAWAVQHWRGARQEAGGERAVFEGAVARFDRDGDGRISLDEWTAARGNEMLFRNYDANHDGYLDVDEFAAMFMAVDPRPGTR